MIAMVMPSNVYLPLHGMTLPAETVDFVRGELARYDTCGHHFGIPYSGRDALPSVEVTLFVLPPMGMSLVNRMDITLDQIRELHGSAGIVNRGEIRIAGREGLRCLCGVDNRHYQEPARVYTWTWLFEADGWLLKYRCTDWLGSVREHVEAALARLVSTVGWPDTAERVQRHLAQAKTRSDSVLRALKDWRPAVAPPHAFIVERADQLAASGDTRGAIALLSSDKDIACERGVAATLSRLYLLEGEIIDATESLLAEEETLSGQEVRLAAAVQAFVPADLAIRGGCGSDFDDAVEISGVSESVTVCGIYRYLACLFGRRNQDWQLQSATLVERGGGMYNVLEVVHASGSSTAIFLRFPSNQSSHSGDSGVLGKATASDEDDAAQQSSGRARKWKMEFPPRRVPTGLFGFTFKHLMEHTSLSLIDES